MANGFFDRLSALSTFVSSVVIAAASLVATNCYNTQQLVIARNKELTTLLPQLGEHDVAKRRAAALSLSLYGRDVIPPLVALLSDPSDSVRDAAGMALEAVGKPARPWLENVFYHSAHDAPARLAALEAWGNLGGDTIYSVARRVLLDTRENGYLRVAAADIMVRYPTEYTAADFHEAIRLSRNVDSSLAAYLLYPMAFLPNAKVTPLIRNLTRHRDPQVREQAIWLIAMIGGAGDEENYRNVLPYIRCDRNPTVQAAVLATALRFNISRDEFTCKQANE